MNKEMILHVRVSEATKAAIRELGTAERRSLSSMARVLLEDGVRMRERYVERTVTDYTPPE